MKIGNSSFRDKASFGKRIEYYIIGKMLKEGLDVYIPIVDDHGVDCIIKNPDGKFIEVQIKARSKKVQSGSEALFGVNKHSESKNFYYIFYSEEMDCTWIMSSKEFNKECSTNKAGKHVGMKKIWLNGKDRKTKKPYPKKQYDKYICEDFSIFK